MTPEQLKQHHKDAVKQGLVYLDNITPDKTPEDIQQLVDTINGDMLKAGLHPEKDESWQAVGLKGGVNEFDFLRYYANRKIGNTPQP